jgi:hypothetical protein
MKGDDTQDEEDNVVWHNIVLNWCNKLVRLSPAGEDLEVSPGVKGQIGMALRHLREI